MSGYGKALFVLLCGALAATKSCTLEILQATDGAGTDAKSVSGKSAVVTANTKVTEATVALVSAAATDKVTVNGVVFTMAASTDASAREFADAAGLVACINDAAYGVAGVTASAVSSTVTLKASEPGGNYITAEGTGVAGTVTVATTQALAFVEVSAGELDTAGGFSHVAAKVTSTGNGIDAVALLRGDSRYGIEQFVGAYASA